MEKVEIAEIKKTLDLKKHCAVEKIKTFYIDEEKNVVSTSEKFLYSIEEEKAFKYLDMLKKALSGKIGKNIFNIEFRTSEEDEKRETFEKAYYGKDAESAEKIVDTIISNYQYPGKYLIIIGFGTYDVPKKTKDNLSIDDSEEVYSYMLTSVCPVVLAKDGLCFDKKENDFESRTDTWMVDKPDFGFLYPSFNGRSTDLNAALYYAKKDLHEDMIAELFGAALGNTSEKEKKAFSAIVQDTLGRDCSYEKVKEITNMMLQRKIDAEFNDDSPEISKRELQKVLESVGATEDGIKQFNRSFDENAGISLKASSLIEKTTKIKSDYVDVSISSDKMDYLESKVIDGHEYLLIPVADNITVNGISILTKREA